MANEERDKPRHETRSEETARKRALSVQAGEIRKREAARLRSAVDNVLKTPAGQRLFKYLFHYCGYNRSSISVDKVTGEVQTIATQHNEATRGVYLHLRGLASPSLLGPAEFAAEFGTEEIQVEKEEKPK